MPTQSIPLGASSLIEQNIVYALPSVLVQIAASIPCEASVDQIAWTPLSADAVTANPFIRCTTGNSLVVAKRASESVGGTTTSILSLSKLNSTPDNPTSGAVLWLQDNAQGKTRLFIRFATGPRIRLAIEA